jgi:flavin-dependent dehydrogenase
MTTVVLGAGPAGSAAAAAARKHGDLVWLVGSPRDHPAGTLEVLSGRATVDLTALGWYDDVVALAQPCDAIIIRWSGTRYTERIAMLEPGGLGWVVDRAWFDPLLRRLATHAGVTRVAAQAQTPSGRLVLATGKHTRANDPRRMLAPNTVALTISAQSGTITDLGRRLIVEATPGGWWSALDDGRHLAVCYVTEPAAARGRAHIRDAWARALRTGPSWLPSGIERAEPRVRPIRSWLQPGAGSSPTRVGDCALSVDPLSGHGLALALEGALRCHDPGYGSWLADQADLHAEQGRALHSSVDYDTSFWREADSAAANQ